jgi:hypothetical protein
VKESVFRARKFDENHWIYVIGVFVKMTHPDAGTLHGEAVSPFCAPAAQYFSAGLVLHPDQKSMRPFALSIIRLVRAFHDTNVLNFKNEQ